MTPLRKNLFDLGRRASACTLCLAITAWPFAGTAQTETPTQPQVTQGASAGQSAPATTSAVIATAPPSNRARRRAARLYLSGGKLYVAGQFEEAMRDYNQAADLDPTNPDYEAAATQARNHQVIALVQAATRERFTGDEAGARASLSQALALDPTNSEVTQHFSELGDDSLRGQEQPLYHEASVGLGGEIDLAPNSAQHSFHLRGDGRTIIQQVFGTYGITAMLDDSVRTQQVRLDVDDVGFAEAMKVLSLVTTTFYVPLDQRRVLVARDTREYQTQFSRQMMETVHLGGLTEAEITEVGNLAKNVFNVAQSSTNASAGTLTLRAPQKTMEAFNATMRDLLDGHNQILLDVRLVQLAHTGSHRSGAQLPQTMSVFNVAAEAQSIFNANQALIQQIISSGLASPTDYLAILGILVASGQVTNSPLANPFAIFGGGLANCTNGVASCTGALTTYGLAPGSAGFNLSLNSSESRALDSVQLRLGDGEAGSLKLGEKYPIQTSSYSSPGSKIPNIPGLTGAGSSSSLSSLLASLGGGQAPIPMIQYQDLGLTLKVTPKVLRGNEVALTIDMKLDGLAGSSINGNPILNSETYTSVVTLKEGETVEVASEMSKSQSRAVSGVPGITDIPGMNNVTDKNVERDYATMLIVITPHVIRGTQAAGHTPLIVVDKNAGTQ